MLADRPNIVLVIFDTARRDRFGCYGYARGTTPAVDAFARESLVFERMITPAPWTIPSHASLFTGLYPREHGADNPVPILRQPTTTLASYLGGFGYETVAVTNNILVHRETGLTDGINQIVLRPYLRENRWMLRARYLLGLRDSGAAAANRAVADLLPGLRRPFFVFMNYLECHWNYTPPRRFERRFATGLSWYRSMLRRVRERDQSMWEAIATADAATLKLYNDLHDAELATLDDRFGRLLELFQKMKLLDNTVFLLAADHGDNIGDEGLASHQGSLRQNLIHVPFIARVPGQRPARIGGLVQFTDVFTGLCRLAGFPAPEHLRERLHGVDPFALRPGDPGRAFAFAEWPHWAPGRISQLEERGLHFDFSRIEQASPHFDFKRIPHGLVAVQDRRYKMVVDADAGRERLFDLERDPHEVQDVAADHPAETSAMRAALLEWQTAHPERGAGSYSAEEQAEVEKRLRELGYI